jgi:hypothetical protein
MFTYFYILNLPCHDRGACPEIKQPNETFLGHDLEKRAKYLKRKKRTEKLLIIEHLFHCIKPFLGEFYALFVHL